MSVIRIGRLGNRRELRLPLGVLGIGVRLKDGRKGPLRHENTLNSMPISPPRVRGGRSNLDRENRDHEVVSSDASQASSDKFMFIQYYLKISE